MRQSLIITYLSCYLLIIHAKFKRPVVITSDRMLNHVPRGYHPENPQRLSESFPYLEKLKDNNLIKIRKPSALDSGSDYQKALDIINLVHDPNYVKEVKLLCEKGLSVLSPWDTDTYISKDSYDTFIIAQSAWMDCVDEVISNQNMAFALTRPPGHHALYSQSMGFCVFNYAVGAAKYSIEKYNIKRIGIIDYDVHNGNGVVALVRRNPNIRYTSLHQSGIFASASGKPNDTGDHGNILNIPLPGGTTWDEYKDPFIAKAIPFIKEHNPELVIVCAGYDAMAGDDTADLGLKPVDYEEIAKELKKAFGTAILFGLEGGYNLELLPQAICHTIAPFLHNSGSNNNNEIISKQSTGWSSPNWNWGYALGEAHDQAKILRAKLSTRYSREEFIRGLQQQSNSVSIEDLKLCLALYFQRAYREGLDGNGLGWEIMNNMADLKYEDGSHGLDALLFDLQNMVNTISRGNVTCVTLPTVAAEALLLCKFLDRGL